MNSGRIPAGDHFQLNEFTAGTCGLDGSLGLVQTISENYGITPNPVESDDDIFFSTKVFGIEVVTSSGSVCYTAKFDAGIYNWKVQLKPGLYSIIIRNQNNEQVVHRLLVE